VDLSVVVPIYNEEESIAFLYERVTSALQNTALVYELILVDDGSSDRSFLLLKDIALQDQRIKVIRFRRNFGQTAAMAAGFDAASGRVVVPMDGDLQNDPTDIPKLLAKIDEGYDVVSGWRKDRQDTFINRKLPSMIANGLISRFTGVHLQDYGCTLKAYRREALPPIHLARGMNRFLPAVFGVRPSAFAEVPTRDRPPVHATYWAVVLPRTSRPAPRWSAAG